MKKKVTISESKSKLKEFFKKLSWWKKIVLLVLIIVVIIAVWKLVHKPYYLKEDFCYSDFLEDCEGKKVEVTGTIVKGGFCPKFETEIYILCKTNIPICKLRSPENYAYDCDYGMHYDDCLGLVQSCFTEDSAIKINDYVEGLLPDSANKKVKIIGDIFIERTSPYVSVSGKVGIIPKSITVIEDKS